MNFKVEFEEMAQAFDADFEMAGQDLDADFEMADQDLNANFETVDQTLDADFETADQDLNADFGEVVNIGGVNFTTDETLTLKNGVLSVNTAQEPEADNTLPITAAAVHASVGNIEILLKTI